MEKKVSVIVPVYNVERYLEEALDSVLGQTLTELEVIAVDDGSTDRSGELLDRYAGRDARIRVIHKKNTGYGHTMNVGLDAADGEYIGILEPDDRMNPGMLQELYTVATTLKLDVAKADFIKFRKAGDGILEKTCKTVMKQQDYYRVFHPRTARPEFFLFSMMSWLGIYRREFLNQWNIRHNETPGASYQDNGFWFQVMSRAERVAHIDSVGYCYRVDNPNASTKQTEKVYAVNEEYAFIFSYLFSRPELQFMMPTYWYHKYDNDRFNLQRIPEPFRYNYVKHMEEEFRAASNKNSLNPGYFTMHYWIEIELLLQDVDAYFARYANLSGK